MLLDRLLGSSDRGGGRSGGSAVARGEGGLDDLVVDDLGTTGGREHQVEDEDGLRGASFMSTSLLESLCDPVDLTFTVYQ